jgi:hypothetical protein
MSGHHTGTIDRDAWLAMWNGPDFDAIRDLSADELEVTAVTATIEPRHYTGREAAVEWLTELRENIRADWSATEITELGGEAVVVEGELCFDEPSSTGAERQGFAILMMFRHGKICWIGTFGTLEAARDAFDRRVCLP